MYTKSSVHYIGNVFQTQTAGNGYVWANYEAALVPENLL